MAKLRLTVLALLGFLLPSVAWADATIPNLSSAGASAGADLLPVSQSNGPAVKQSITNIFATPPALGGTTPAAVSATNLSANGTVSGTGFSAYLASPPAIGGTAAGAGAFTTLSASSTVSGAGFSAYLASPPAIGGTAPAAITGTTGHFTGAFTLDAGITAGGLSAGTQVSCLGLDSGNHVVLNAAACGSGSGGSLTVTDGTHSVAATTTLTITGGTVGGTSPSATLSITASAGGTSGQLQINSTGSLGGITLGGDCTFSTPNITCTKTSGVAFATSATTDTTNATNITSGTLAFARMATIATNTLYGNSSGSTGVPSAQTVGAGLVMNANGLQTTANDRTSNAGATIGSADMGGVINLTGTGNLVVPAISSTVLTTGMTASYQNQGSGIITVSSTPTINGLPHTAIPPGGFGTFVGNGTTIDWTGLSSPTATQIGGVMSIDCSAGGQFLQKINTDGTETCGTPAGGGNVSAAGTLTLHGVVLGAGTQAVSITAVGTTGIPLIGQTGADPVFGTAAVAGGGTGATTFTAHGVLFGEGTGAIAVSAAGGAGNPLVGTGATTDPGFVANAFFSTTGETLTLGNNAGPAGTLVIDDGAGSNTQLVARSGANVVMTPPAASGTLATTTVAGGGTGAATFTAHGIMLGEGTSALTPTAAMTDGQLLVGQTSADPLPKTMSGDATLAATGAITLKTSGALAGSWTTTTQSALDNSTKVATTAYVDKAANAVLSSGSITATGTREIIYCSTTCTVTLPVPAVGYQFCVANNVGVSTVITIAAVSTVLYGKTDQSAYGTVSTGTMVSGGAVGDKVCLIGVDSTHYNVGSYNGSWTNS